MYNRVHFYGKITERYERGIVCENRNVRIPRDPGYGDHPFMIIADEDGWGALVVCIEVVSIFLFFLFPPHSKENPATPLINTEASGHAESAYG